MFIKVKLSKQAQEAVSGSYINTDKIVEVYYDLKAKEYIAVVDSPYFDQMSGKITRSTAAYLVEEADYNKLVNKRKSLKE